MNGRREGAALLTVLLLLAVLSAVIVILLDDVRFSLRRASNLELGGQATWLALGGETLARSSVERMARLWPTRTPVNAQWLAKPVILPVEGGAVSIRLEDAEACFNLNSLVRDGAVDPIAAEHLETLARTLGISTARLRRIAAGLTTRIEGEAVPTRLRQVETLRTMPGVDPATYEALKPFVCTLPTTNAAQINVNGLTVQQAPLLVMATQGRLSLATAEALLKARPPGGWADEASFWAQPALMRIDAQHRRTELVGMRTRFFKARVRVDLADSTLVRTALIEVNDEGVARSIWAAWGNAA